MGLDGIIIGVELAFVSGLFSEGIEIGGILGGVNVFGELVDPVKGIVLRGDIGALAFNAIAQIEDVVEQSGAKGHDKQVGEHHLPTGPASAWIIVSAFLRHDGAKIKLFLKFAAISIPIDQ